MTRVHVICEGQTEETFVNELLGPHLHAFNVFTQAALVGKPGQKGGNVTTDRMARDVRLRLTHDKHAWCTTFFDYYGLAADFAGKPAAEKMPSFSKKADIIETALRAHILTLTDETAIRRFIPYVQMYEFEGLLFSDPNQMATGLYTRAINDKLTTIRSLFATPEEINNHVTTAPSKRIQDVFPGYDKQLGGILAALAVGLPKIRQECRRFDGWVRQLESIGRY
jgi:hypothetical protein